ncbi:hypothetical protein CALVIDRAFT_301529 [Calocera viscosa TUFC12733]|uniref:F-box domain-containing protein n=1 Tax=Calocera viscosa (strain TUFC12733) TaxID=1330018 RepID=A0A167IJJ9_CALVF|nr:hypothetical protein CALVIDRAFT_301529 [Calocera viscosa TUFC12733]
MTEDRDCLIHATKLREAVDAARCLVDKLSAVPSRKSIRTLLHQDDKHQMALQTVYDLEDALQSVLRDVDELRNRLLSPSTRLHDELLQEIFLYCSDSTVRVHPLQNTWKKFNPLVLTGVCSRWRTVALNTATLWAELSIESNSDASGSWANPWLVLRGGGDVESQIQRSGRYRAFLERSKQAGLGLSLNLHQLIPDSNQLLRVTDEVRQLGTKGGGINRLCLKTHARRDEINLESLKLVQQTVRDLKIVRTPEGPGSVAEAFGMNGDSIFSNEWPQLRSLTLSGIIMHSRPTLPYVPLRHLRKMDLFVDRTTTDVGILNVLQLCSTTLEELFVSYNWSTAGSSVPEGSSVPQMTPFPRLQHLKLGSLQDNLTVLLQHIWTPSLTQLDLHSNSMLIDGQQPDSTPFLAALSKFVQESQCRLEVVSLVEIPRSAWKEIVESTAAPTICSALYGNQLGDPMPHERVLDLQIGLDRLLNLEELVSVEPQSSLELEKMLQFVQSRQRLRNRGVSIKPIRRLAIQGRKAGTAEEHRECARLQKELAELVEHLVIELMRFDRTNKEWVFFEGGGDWHYTPDRFIL